MPADSPAPEAPPASSPPPASRFLQRLTVLFALGAILLFAGLWLREKRLSLERQLAPNPAAQQTSALEAQLRSHGQLLVAQQQALKRAQLMLAMAAEPGLPGWSLGGEKGQGRAILSPTRKALLVMTLDLPEPPGSQGYQVWGLRSDGSSASLGMLPAPLEDLRILMVPPPEGELKGISVTLEPATGSTGPSQQLALSSSLPIQAPKSPTPELAASSPSPAMSAAKSPTPQDAPKGPSPSAAPAR